MVHGEIFVAFVTIVLLMVFILEIFLYAPVDFSERCPEKLWCLVYNVFFLDRLSIQVLILGLYYTTQILKRNFIQPLKFCPAVKVLCWNVVQIGLCGFFGGLLLKLHRTETTTRLHVPYLETGYFLWNGGSTSAIFIKNNSIGVIMYTIIFPY